MEEACVPSRREPPMGALAMTEEESDECEFPSQGSIDTIHQFPIYLYTIHAITLLINHSLSVHLYITPEMNTPFNIFIQLVNLFTTDKLYLNLQIYKN